MGCRLNRLGEELRVVVTLGTFGSLNNNLMNNIFYNAFNNDNVYLYVAIYTTSLDLFSNCYLSIITTRR